MTATTYETQTAAVVAGTATIDAGGSLTEAIVLDSKQNLILMAPEFTSGSYLGGNATLLTFQVQAFDGGDFVEAADEDGNTLSVLVGPGNLAPAPSLIASAYAIKVRSGSATGPVAQEAAREIQFVASSPASNIVATDPLDVVIDAGTALIGRVSASPETSTVYNATTALTPKFAKIDAASNGNNTVVGAVTSKKIRVLSANLVATGAVTAAWQSGAGGTALSGTMSFAANGGYVLPFNPTGWFETAAGSLLNLSLGGAVQVSGTISYVEV